MRDSFSTISKRKAYFQNLAGELDRRICESHRASGDRYGIRKGEAPAGIRGLFIDGRTLRAISLKVKMLLTLLSKAYILWQNSPIVRKFINFPASIEPWIKNNPWKPEAPLIIHARIIPFISREYIQASIKFLDIECNNIPQEMVLQKTLPEKNLSTWSSHGIDASGFSFLNSLAFFKEQIDHALEQLTANPSPSVLLIGEAKETAGESPEYIREIIS